MEFGPVPPRDALGAILAHSLALPDGRLRKGAVLCARDIARIRAAGLASVTVARLGPADVDEDRAALRLTQALVPDPAAAGLAVRAVGTGRVNLHATAAGVLAVKPARIHAVNAADPMLTLATLPPWQRLSAGDMVATIKVIAYGVALASLDAACAAAAGAVPALRLCPVRIGHATLIQTRLDSAAPGTKGPRVVGARLGRLGVAMHTGPEVAHAEEPLARAIADAAATDTEMILILTGTATSDIRDTAPAALRRAGGQVGHFGMPVDPGNLLFVGNLGQVPVIGLPGCARSPALNGADWVIERLACGLPLGAADIMAMGVGGLLKESPARGHPRSSGAD